MLNIRSIIDIFQTIKFLWFPKCEKYYRVYVASYHEYPGGIYLAVSIFKLTVPFDIKFKSNFSLT